MRARALYLFFVLVALTSLPAWSQQYSLQTYGRKAGLESLTINVLMQDRRGFVWAGTEMGLYRFDGNNFERMQAPQGFDKGEYVTAVAQAPHLNTIWVATQSGLRMGDGLHFRKVKVQGQPLVVDVGRQMMALDDGSLLLIRKDRLMRLSGGRGQPWQLRSVFSAAQQARYPQLRMITVVYRDRDRLWLGCARSLCESHLDGGAVRIDGPAQGVPADDWSGVFRDHAGNLWLRGVHHVRELQAGTKQFIDRDVPQDAMDVVNDDGSFVEDPQGRILTATNRGLARWDGHKWSLIDSRNGLPDIGITTELFDSQGTLWLGTYGRGIARWNGYGQVEGWTRGQGVDSVPSWSILRSDRDHMWFGNELGGSVLATGATSLRPWPLQITPAPRQILSLAKAPDGAIWAGLYDYRILRYDPVSHRTTLAATLPAFVKVLHFDHRGRLWIGTVNGIYRIDGPGMPAAKVSTSETTDQQCSDIAEGADGTLWFACNEGMLRYALGRWTHMSLLNRHLVSGFSAVAVASDGSLWLGANEPGVFHAVVHDNQLVLSHQRDFWLDSSLAYFVRRDHRGWIWVGGGGGVDVFNGSRWNHLSMGDGLLWDETDQNAFFADDDGSVWIGSAIGISHILHPEAMVARRTPRVIITSVLRGDQVVVNGETLPTRGHRASLAVRYAVLGASPGNAARFRYRLQGSEWIDTDSHVINLTGLPAGDYRLEIQAMDLDQRSVSATTTFMFIVPPPWWLAWWMYPLELLLLGLLVVLCWRWYSRRLITRSRSLERIVAGRTAELTAEKRALERARAELYYQATHDGLTGLYNHRAILDHLSALVDPARRPSGGLAVGLIDADHFKHINDSFGHQAGDATLVAIARHLRVDAREGEWYGRYGGEEILVALPGLARQPAEKRMWEIQLSTSAIRHHWGHESFNVTLSIGMVWVGYEQVTLEELIRRADAALYQAKSRGRNRVEVARVARTPGDRQTPA